MEIKNRELRDNYIVQDYAAGMDIKAIARDQGISDRRVMQILKSNGVEFRARKKRFEMKPISQAHERIGRMLVDHRFDNETEQHEAASDLGWSLLKLKKPEEGIIELELLDLMDVAAYTDNEIGTMLSPR